MTRAAGGRPAFASARQWAAACLGQEVALEVDPDDRVPVVLVEVDQHPVAQEARVVDQGVEASEGVQGGGDQGGGALGGGDVAAVGDGLAARRRDRVHDLPGG
ncbi:hypothetical protein SCALM49S_02912 [Streptomyces californicus]